MVGALLIAGCGGSKNPDSTGHTEAEFKSTTDAATANATPAAVEAGTTAATPPTPVDTFGMADTYTVAEGDSLQLISLAHYGTMKRWQEIANLNNLPAPYRIKIKQTLRLPERATITRAQSNELLLRHWRRKLALREGIQTPANPIVTAPEKTETPTAPTPNAKPKRVPAAIPTTEINLEQLHKQREIQIEKETKHTAVITKLAKSQSLETALELAVAEESRVAVRGDSRLVWLSGSTAKAVYGNMKAAKDHPGTADPSSLSPNDLKLSKLKRRVGKNMVCAHFPKFQDGKAVEFEVRCLGFVPETKRDIASN